MKLSNSMREELKKPLGLLIPESQVNAENIALHISSDTFIITVGDRTTQKMIDYDLIPSLQIIDGFEKRMPCKIPKLENATNISIVNPAAQITVSSINKIKEAFLLEPPVRLQVDGEEDLLVIPVCIHAPKNAVVLYGQPNKGIVLVKITPEIRNKAQVILDSMK